MVTTDRSKPWVLTLDASTPDCVIALGRADATGMPTDFVAGRLVATRANEASARLTASIAALLHDTEVRPQQLCAVGCGRGPGTFTGTRVAVATAMGLATGIGTPVISVSTLAAVAASVATQPVPAHVVALLDARRGEVYGARFECPDGNVRSLRRVSPERVAAVEALLAECAPDCLAIGPGVTPYHDAIANALDPPPVATGGPSPAGLFAATAVTCATEGTVAAEQLRAVYLRASYAQMGVNVAKRPFKRSPFA